MKVPGFCIPKSNGYEATCSPRGEARRGLIQTSVKQQENFSYSELIARTALQYLKSKRNYFAANGGIDNPSSRAAAFAKRSLTDPGL